MKYGVILIGTNYFTTKFVPALGEGFYLFTGTREEYQEWIKTHSISLTKQSNNGTD